MIKKIGMMQPYLFPYLGYFQLMSAVDVFVLGDDLQYVKESWINRNRILVNGKESLITFPLKKDSHRSKINERVFAPNFSEEMDKLLRVISQAYSKAPYFRKVFPFLQELIRFPEPNLAKYAENSIRKIACYLGINTPIFIASDLSISDVVDKQDRVIKTAKKMGANFYINFIGGVSLYNSEQFKEHGIELKFHRINDVRYPQFRNAFVPLLSIIDVLMFNSVSEVRKLLPCYTLVEGVGGPFKYVPVCAQQESRASI